MGTATRRRELRRGPRPPCRRFAMRNLEPAWSKSSRRTFRLMILAGFDVTFAFLGLRPLLKLMGDGLHGSLG